MPEACMQRGTSKMKRFHKNSTACPPGGRHPQPRAIFLMICCGALLLTLPAGDATGAIGANHIVAIGDAAV
jgi:hypothetical protein